jgi:oligopeptide/dipeptide ABC transporter ATP-binding protein
VENTLELVDLKTYFYTQRGVVKAVDGVSLTVGKGETLGIVGESGCGKSITCLSMLRLVPQPAGKIVGGKILLDGEDLLTKTEKEMRDVRGGRISMILQDPMTSMNPVFTVGQHVSWPIKIHQEIDRQGVWSMVAEMLSRVKIPSPKVRMREYPHQMSGGMRQRIVGAMGLSCQPSLLIADEPTTALDVTIQAQFLRLLDEIQKDTGLSLIVVTHDLGIVAKICDRVAVMYAGKVVENAPLREIFDNPKHPYTIALMNSRPRMDSDAEMLYTIDGQPPDLAFLPQGCSFSPRCPKVHDVCEKQSPTLNEVAGGHVVSCWLCT